MAYSKKKRGKKNMNISEALEGDYINVKMVQESPSKKCVIIGAGKMDENEFGKKLAVPVEIDGKTKTWRMNKMTLQNMSILGMDTIKWLGVSVGLVILNVKGKDCVIGQPVTPVKQPFEFRARDGE